MRHELIAAMGELNADASVRAIVLTGSGNRAFTAGQDLGELAPLDADGGAAWVRDLGRLYQSIRDLDKQIAVAMNGLATGAGLQLGLHPAVPPAHPGVRIERVGA